MMRVMELKVGLSLDSSLSAVNGAVTASAGSTGATDGGPGVVKTQHCPSAAPTVPLIRIPTGRRSRNCHSGS